MIEQDKVAFFKYGEKEIEHLKKADKRLADVIDKIGMVKRPVIPDLFAALVNSIVGQQISTKAHQTIWIRMQKEFGEITSMSIDSFSKEKLQQAGITFKKAGYIKSISQRILNGDFDINSLHSMSDEEVCRKLSQLDGIGVWTAEMLMLHSMQRPNILSYGDLAIHRGLRMIYHHREIDKERFSKYWKRYTPYASVASLYLWAVSAGSIAGVKDYISKK